MHSYSKGRFSGKYDTSQKVKLWDVLQWKLFGKSLFKHKEVPAKSLQIKDDSSLLMQKENFICWLSHASFLIQLGGKRILIDPVFGDIPLHKRQIPAPYSVDTLKQIDYLLLSHVHYDHFDKSTLRKIAPKNPHAVIPLKMSSLLKKTATFKTTELDWYKTYTDEDISITLVPAKHWGRRGIFDRNKVLWGAYIIRHKDSCIFFCGDSAMGEHFREIGERFEIDYALMPIGAYAPKKIMQHNHLNPKEAVEASNQLGTKTMIPMHYGTYKLSNEPIDEPLVWLNEASKRTFANIEILQPGEVFTLL